MAHTTSQPSTNELLTRISRERSKGSPFGAAIASSASTAPASEMEHPEASLPSGGGRAAARREPADEFSNEPFISRRTTKKGELHFCVQIRRRTENGVVSASKTLASMNEAKNWRDDTLAKIQLGMFEPKPPIDSDSEPLVKELLSKKKNKGRYLERSANQVLDSLIGHSRCAVPASEIDMDWFQEMAADLLRSGMLPQTAASYMTILASSLKWAHKRGDNVPYDTICRAMGLCCTNPVRDSSRESSVVAGGHEQTHARDLQDDELASL